MSKYFYRDYKIVLKKNVALVISPEKKKTRIGYDDSMSTNDVLMFVENLIDGMCKPTYPILKVIEGGKA